MAVKNLLKPVFLSSVICVFVFYSGFFNIPDRTSPRTLLNTQDITLISGKLISSPAKTGNGSYYAATFSLQAAADARNFHSSAKGRVKVMIPAALAEAYSPGKLFSQSRISASSQPAQAFLFESGGHCTFRGRLSQDSFYVRECSAAWWPPARLISLTLQKTNVQLGQWRRPPPGASLRGPRIHRHSHPGLFPPRRPLPHLSTFRHASFHVFRNRNVFRKKSRNQKTHFYPPHSYTACLCLVCRLFSIIDPCLYLCHAYDCRCHSRCKKA